MISVVYVKMDKIESATALASAESRVHRSLTTAQKARKWSTTIPQITSPIVRGGSIIHSSSPNNNSGQVEPQLQPVNINVLTPKMMIHATGLRRETIEAEQNGNNARMNGNLNIKSNDEVISAADNITSRNFA